jgi:hypothetical protein
VRERGRGCGAQLHVAVQRGGGGAAASCSTQAAGTKRCRLRDCGADARLRLRRRERCSEHDGAQAAGLRRGSCCRRLCVPCGRAARAARHADAAPPPTHTGMAISRRAESLHTLGSSRSLRSQSQLARASRRRSTHHTAWCVLTAVRRTPAHAGRARVVLACWQSMACRGSAVPAPQSPVTLHCRRQGQEAQPNVLARASMCDGWGLCCRDEKETCALGGGEVPRGRAWERRRGAAEGPTRLRKVRAA